MHRSFQIALVVTTWVLLALSFIHAEHLGDQPLHHVPTVIALVVLGMTARRGTVSDASMSSIFLFLWLHILGARYIYSFVPYDEWTRRWLGWSMTEAFHFTRNHFDRFVHFAYGVLAVVPQVEFLRSALGMRRGWALTFSVVLVLAVSALYEIVESSVAMVMAPEWADRYNGQQGDLWDPQKDMALALVGALLMTALLLVLRRRTDVDTSG